MVFLDGKETLALATFFTRLSFLSVLFFWHVFSTFDASATPSSRRFLRKYVYKRILNGFFLLRRVIVANKARISWVWECDVVLAFIFRRSDNVHKLFFLERLWLLLGLFVKLDFYKWESILSAVFWFPFCDDFLGVLFVSVNLLLWAWVGACLTHLETFMGLNWNCTGECFLKMENRIRVDFFF